MDHHPLSPVRLFQVKMEREQHQTEIRDLQDQLSEMHDELDSTKRSEDREKGALIEVRGWRSAVTCLGGWASGVDARQPLSFCCVCLFHRFLHLGSVRPSLP